MRPYILTTKRPIGRTRLLDGGSSMGVVCRRAVATLEAARNAVYDDMLDMASAATRPWPAGSNMSNWHAVDSMPESGYTFSLPDGTVTEVEQATWHALAAETGHLDPPAFCAEGSERTILDAFNARQP